MTTPWSGAVLCGGRSRRMGRDKALLLVDGEPMALRVAAALRAAGAAEVFAVGGDLTALSGLGLKAVPDGAAAPEPGAGFAPGGDQPAGGPSRRHNGGGGPLVGIVTALGVATTEIVMVVACDLVSPSADAMAATVAALGAAAGGDVAMPYVDGVPQWLHGAWRKAVRPRLVEQLAGGERAVHRAVAAAHLRLVEVTGLPAVSLADADAPADLPQPPAPS